MELAIVRAGGSGSHVQAKRRFSTQRPEARKPGASCPRRAAKDPAAPGGRTAHPGGPVQSLTKRRITESELRSLVRHGFGERARVSRWHELTGGTFNAAYWIRLIDDTELVLKVAPPPELKLLTHEVDLMRSLRRRGDIALAVVQVGPESKQEEGILSWLSCRAGESVPVLLVVSLWLLAMRNSRHPDGPAGSAARPACWTRWSSSGRGAGPERWSRTNRSGITRTFRSAVSGRSRASATRCSVRSTTSRAPPPWRDFRTCR